MRRKLYAILNAIIVVVLIGWNGYANSGNFNGKNVGDLSAEYNNLFTPASYAFSIWGLIFLSLLIFCAYGLYYAFNDKHRDLLRRLCSSDLISNNQKKFENRTDFILTTPPFFLIANVLCSLWVAFWLEEMILVSVLIMFGLLSSLLICIKRLDLEIWDAPIHIIAFVWWPLCLYAGWISVATIANVASYLVSVTDFTIDEQITITIVMIAVAVVINLFMIVKRNMREFALVGVWALIAIAVRHFEEVTWIAYTSLLGAVVLFIAAGIHGSRNKETSPIMKYKEYKSLRK